MTETLYISHLYILYRGVVIMSYIVNKEEEEDEVCLHSCQLIEAQLTLPGQDRLGTRVDC